MKRKIEDRFAKALVRDKKKQFRRLLRKHPELANAPVGPVPALIVAAALGRDNMLRRLLKNGASLQSANGSGTPALFAAALEGHYVCALHLLRAGCPVDAAGADGLTALHAAASRGHEDIVTLLLFHAADPHRQDTAGRTPLDLALAAGHQNVVDALAAQSESLVPTALDELDDEEALTDFPLDWDAFGSDADDLPAEPEKTQGPRIRAEFAKCDWCGASIMIGSAGVSVNRSIEQVEWNFRAEREEIQVIDSECVLQLCAACGNKLNLTGLKTFLTESPAARL
ncbi:MAG TPA: ankyrin repeat domain-containing protein [Armatimonadota bacterium]|jgi:hypothetical protein